MAPRQSYENIFQTGLPRGQAQKLTSPPFHLIEQGGNRQVQFLHVERNQAIAVIYTTATGGPVLLAAVVHPTK